MCAGKKTTQLLPRLNSLQLRSIHDVSANRSSSEEISAAIRGAGSAAQANHYNQIVFSLTLWALGRSPQQLNCSTGDSATQSQQSLVKMFRLGKLFSAAPGLWSVAEPWSKSSIKREAIGQFQAPKPRSTYLVASVFGSNYWFVYTH